MCVCLLDVTRSLDVALRVRCTLRGVTYASVTQTRYFLFVVSIGDEDFYCIVAGME